MGTFETYEQFQQYCAYLGHTYTPLSRRQFNLVNDENQPPDYLYGIACDVAAGLTFIEAVEANT